MKPLSSSLYNIRNKRKILSSINAVMVAVCFIHILYSFTQGILYMVDRNSSATYKKAAIVMQYGDKPIDKALIKVINENENVERVIPTPIGYGIHFNLPGNSDRAAALSLRPVDRDFLLKKYNIKLIAGRLPREGQNEIAISKAIAKNRELKLGGKVGDGINEFDNLPGVYTVVGILDSYSLLSILSANESIFPDYRNKNVILGRNFLVFPKPDRKAAMDRFLEQLPKDNVDVSTESIFLKHLEKNLGALRVIDIISILSILVMVITVGSSKYAQYINRKEELGVLNALGYSKLQILNRTFKEVVTINLIGYLLGIALGILLSYGLGKGIWEPKGGKGFLFTAKGFFVSSFVPLFTILFSIIPINNLISKLDPIRMIEKN